MLLVKLRNAADLLWDSLDGQERFVLVYTLLSLAFALLVRARQVEREQLKRELLDELQAADDGRR